MDDRGVGSLGEGRDWVRGCGSHPARVVGDP